MSASAASESKSPEVAHGAAVDVLLYAISKCVLGEVLVARSSMGVCAVLLADTARELEIDLSMRFPHSTLVADKAAVQDEGVYDAPLSCVGADWAWEADAASRAVANAAATLFRDLINHRSVRG